MGDLSRKQLAELDDELRQLESEDPKVAAAKKQLDDTADALVASAIQVGDCIVAHWRTPGGTVKKVRGEVTALKKGKVRFKYQRTTMSGRSIDMEILEVWRPLEQCKKVERAPGELPVGRSLTALVYAMAGKEMPEHD
jgi:hypothetical protein